MFLIQPRFSAPNKEANTSRLDYQDNKILQSSHEDLIKGRPAWPVWSRAPRRSSGRKNRFQDHPTRLLGCYYLQETDGNIRSVNVLTNAAVALQKVRRGLTCVRCRLRAFYCLLKLIKLILSVVSRTPTCRK